MKVSVVIPTKNPGVKFRDVLKAVLDQRVEFEYEVLIIDSGSSDGTVEFVKSLENKKVKLHLIKPAEFGHGKTRNLGVQLTTGEYVAFITHDAMPADENWLSELVVVMDSDSQIAGVFGRHLAYPTARYLAKTELDTHFKGFEDQPIVFLEDLIRYQNDQGYRQFLHFFSDNNALIRRSVWNIQPYPEVDFAEDQLWAKMIIELGYKKAYAKNAKVFHSHDYSMVERLQRSFDESFAFHNLFGYTICSSYSDLFFSWKHLVKRDFSFIKKAGIRAIGMRELARMPFDNFSRMIGSYLGSNANNLPVFLMKYISWDRRLALGLRTGFDNK